MFVAKKGVDTVYPMFKIGSGIKYGDTIYATVRVNPWRAVPLPLLSLFRRARRFLSNSKDGPFSVVGGVSGSATQTYHFTLPASAAGTRVPVCILGGDLTAKPL